MSNDDDVKANSFWLDPKLKSETKLISVFILSFLHNGEDRVLHERYVSTARECGKHFARMFIWANGPWNAVFWCLLPSAAYAWNQTLTHESSRLAKRRTRTFVDGQRVLFSLFLSVSLVWTSLLNQPRAAFRTAHCFEAKAWLRVFLNFINKERKSSRLCRFTPEPLLLCGIVMIHCFRKKNLFFTLDWQRISDFFLSVIEICIS